MKKKHRAKNKKISAGMDQSGLRVNWFRAGLLILFSCVLISVCGNISTLFNVTTNLQTWHVRSSPTVLADLGFYLSDMILIPSRLMGSHVGAHAGYHDDTVFTLLSWIVHFGFIAAFCTILTVVWRHQHDVVLTAKIIWVEAWLLGCKGIAQALTVMPDSNPHRPVCHEPSFAEPGWWIMKRFSVNHCGDMLYSGHTSHVVLALLLLWYCCGHPHAGSAFGKKPASVAFSFIMFVTLFLLYVLCMLIVRLHYSVDILVGAVLTILLFTHQDFVRFGTTWLLTE